MSNNAYENKLDEYYDRFGDIFPSMEYGMPINEAIKFMDKCLSLNKKAQEISPLANNVDY